MRYPTKVYEWECGEPDAPKLPDVTYYTGEGPWCDEVHPEGDWTCTRTPGHTQRHAAGDGDTLCAVWGVVMCGCYDMGPLTIACPEHWDKLTEEE